MDSRMLSYILSIFIIDELPGDKNQCNIVQQLDILISKNQVMQILYLYGGVFKNLQRFFKDCEVEEIVSS